MPFRPLTREEHIQLRVEATSRLVDRMERLTAALRTGTAGDIERVLETEGPAIKAGINVVASSLNIDIGQDLRGFKEQESRNMKWVPE